MKLIIVAFTLMLLTIHQGCAVPDELNKNKVAHSLAEVAYQFTIAGDIKNAKKYISESIRYQVNIALSYYVRGQLEEASKNITAAVKFYNKAIYTDSNFELANLALGRIYLNSNNLEWAQYSLQKAYSINPRNWITCYYLADIFAKKGYYEQAIELYLYVLRQKKHYSLIYAKIGNIYFNLEKYKEALKNFKKAEDSGLRTQQLFFRIGYIYGLNSNVKEEISYYRKALKIDPMSAMINLNLGIALLTKNNDSKSAMTRFLVAIELSPNMKESYYNLGNLYMRERDNTLAKKALSKAVELDPGYTQAYLALAVVYKAENDFINSDLIYKKALSFDKSDYKILLNYGAMLIEAKQYAKAEKILRAASKAAPSVIEVNYNLGLLYGLTARNILAKKEFYKVLIKDTKNFRALNYVGMLFMQERDYNTALDYYKKSVKINPFFVDAYFNMAVVYEMSGRNDIAGKMYFKVLEIDPKNAEARNNLGHIYEKFGYYELAIEQYEKASRYNPELVQAYYNLGNVYELQKTYDLALTHYEKVIELQPEHRDAHNRIMVVKAQIKKKYNL